MEDYELHKQLYKGKASLLYRATCRLSGTLVALKLYRKARLSELNWYQVSCPHPKDIFSMTHFIHVKHALLQRSLLQGCSSYQVSYHLISSGFTYICMGCTGAAGDQNPQPAAA